MASTSTAESECPSPIPSQQDPQLEEVDVEVELEEEVFDDDDEDLPLLSSMNRPIEVDEEIPSGVEGQYNLCYCFSHISLIYLVIQMKNEINDIFLCIYCDKWNKWQHLVMYILWQICIYYTLLLSILNIFYFFVFSADSEMEHTTPAKKKKGGGNRAGWSIPDTTEHELVEWLRSNSYLWLRSTKDYKRKKEAWQQKADELKISIVHLEK